MVAFAFALAIVGGWFKAPGKVPIEVTDQESMWAARHPKNYTYRIESRCECDMRPRVSTVRDGVVLDAWYEAPGGAVPIAREGRGHELLTVEGLYDYLSAGYRKRYAKIDITFDPVLHYPKRVYIDRIASAVDDEAELLVSVTETHGGG